MSPLHAHTIHNHHHHFGWNRDNSPVLTVAPGETAAFECLDAGCGHYHPGSTAADIATMAPEKVNPVTGPVFIDGASPGDTLKITIEAFRPSGFGWTALIPGFGLLADQFPDPRLHLWQYDASGRQDALFSGFARIPVRPFAGTLGVAPHAAGTHPVIPPRNVGGNMDIRHLTAGATLHLPVEVEGALFSMGDTHAAQGDGEVCGTAIESAMEAVVTFDVIKGKAPPSPRFRTPGRVADDIGREGHEVTTGIGPDLMQAAREAVSRMIDLMAHEHGMTPEDAYMLCSVCADLRISEIVNAPNMVVSLHFPRSVLS
ncbi:acetamidase/formamidase family protein [Zhengella sp. ZM62]|uniref:acetamidase/formamidase family protein n=1 Tax=Zhengella sedimenti TaxID=3390035 RepID=UPI003975F671